jgi:phosphoribosylanthranilate isomerase
MPLKTKVKVGNITNLSDARYCAGMGVDLLGFPLKNTDGSPLSPGKFTDITGWVSGPAFVLETGDANLAEVYQTIASYPAQYIELDASQLDRFDPAYIEKLIVSVDIHHWEKWKNKIIQAKDSIAYLLIRNDREGNPTDVKSLMEEMAQSCAVLLGFGVVKETLADVLQLPIAGISLRGSDEEKPGVKEYHLADILEALDED